MLLKLESLCVCVLKMQMYMLKYKLFDRRCCKAPSQHQIYHSCLVLIEFYCFIKQPHCQYLIAYTWPLQTNTTEIASIFQRVLQLGSYFNSLCICKNFLGSIMMKFSHRKNTGEQFFTLVSRAYPIQTCALLLHLLQHAPEHIKKQIKLMT